MKRYIGIGIVIAVLVTVVSLAFAGGDQEPEAMMSGENDNLMTADIPVPPPGIEGEYTKPADEKLEAVLTPTQYAVTQHDGTEPPFQNEYWDNKRDGIYVDIVSGEPLFSSTDKYVSGTGWPSFTKPLEPGNVVSMSDKSLGMVRTEVRSLFADSHLGHVFNDGPQPTGLRYCMNSASMRFIPVERLEEEGYGRYLALFGMKTSSDSMGDTMAMGGDTEGLEMAVFAGGCFWGVEAVFERLEGVHDAVSGYSGGQADTAFYQMVGTGKTGHAEAVQVAFDPEVISYETLLDVFFTVAHDPTQLNYQGPDYGTEYRSAIFFANDEQRMATERYIEELSGKEVYKDPIVTEVAELDAFYPAEDYHQDFMRLNPTHPYILYWDVPKVEHLEEAFPDLVTNE